MRSKTITPAYSKDYVESVAGHISKQITNLTCFNDIRGVFTIHFLGHDWKFPSLTEAQAVEEATLIYGEILKKCLTQFDRELWAFVAKNRKTFN